MFHGTTSKAICRRSTEIMKTTKIKYNLSRNHSTGNHGQLSGGSNSRFRDGPNAPKLPKKGIVPVKAPIPQVHRLIAVSSAKGGVGKSTVAVNLAMAIAMQPSRPSVGILDLDVFGPSIPRIMGLTDAPEPDVNQFNHIIPLKNHGVQCMSMGFLLSREAQFKPPPPDPNSTSKEYEEYKSKVLSGEKETPRSWMNDREAAPIVWRGLMVQKVTQQLLFEVDWSGGGSVPNGVDVLVVDMPPGTGDVALTLGQLARVDGVVIVSTAQDVALADVKKGVALFRKINVPMLGMLLNMSHYVCASCSAQHALFGSSSALENAAAQMSLPILGKLPLVSQLSMSADRGVPLMMEGIYDSDKDPGVASVTQVMNDLAATVMKRIM